MTPEHQRIAIAEFCGWREAFPRHKDLGKERGGILLPYKWEQVGTHKKLMEPPNYPLDLNAMHEAENKLNNSKDGTIYAQWLLKIVLKFYQYTDWSEIKDEIVLNGWACMQLSRATAQQRSEAFCRTIGKWVEE